MNYLKLYYKIIDKAKESNRNGYLELHHIIPRCIYGENLLDENLIHDVNQDSNLVYLTAREHFIAHWLLHREFPKNKKLGLAFWAMAGMISPDHKRTYIPSSRAIEEARFAATNARKVEILQYDLEGNFLKEFKSLNDASNFIGIVPNAIGQNLNSYSKSAGSFQWRFKTKNYKHKIESYFSDNNGLPVGQYDLNGNLISNFESLMEAERKTGHSEGSIRAAMNRGTKIKNTSYFFIQFHKNQEIPKLVDPLIIPLHGFSIPIVQISSNEKYIINEFQSISHAAKFLNKTTGHISSVCKGKRKTAYGYIWKYKKDYVTKLPYATIEEIDLKLHSKPIAQYDLYGNYLKTFKSASEAARETNDKQGNISSVALGKRKYSKNYQYAYIEKNNIPRKNSIIRSDNISKKVQMLDLISGELINEFESISLAAKSINGSQSNISACINGRKKTAYGFKWIFK
ncbi:MAG: NUMOD1 domain-containing DNA-binding protein [Flavobacterium sp.]|nr:NUMOD1 domain-containing DNA-binding protein [Flavobacterium sp.]